MAPVVQKAPDVGKAEEPVVQLPGQLPLLRLHRRQVHLPHQRRGTAVLDQQVPGLRLSHVWIQVGTTARTGVMAELYVGYNRNYARICEFLTMTFCKILV